MKRWMKYVVVLSIVAGGVLFTNLQDKFWVWADDGIFNIICKNKGIEEVNLLMIAHGGQEKPVLPGEKEDDPGARTIGYSTYPDSDVLYKSELMRLFILGACVPEDVSPDATVKLDLLHNDGERIRLWEDQTTPPPPISLPTDFSLQDISLYKSVWVEATAPSESQGDITICAKLIDPDKPSDHSETESTACRDTVTVTAVLINLSIDSDNTNGLQEPDDSEDEDRIEDDPSKPGKILVVNTWDMNHDGIPNFADGFTTEKFHNAGNTAGGNFVPLVLTLLPGSIDWTNAQVKFHYDASDPGDVGYDDHQTPDDPSDDTYSLPQQGHLRLWTKDGVANRHIDDDYIQSGVAYNITDLLSGDGYTIPLYVEGVQASPADPDLRRIHVDLDPTGDGQFFEDVDAVRVTVVAATDITIYRPESDDFTEPLDWGEVIFRDEPVRAKITLSSEIPALEVFQEMIELCVFSRDTHVEWWTIPLDNYAELASNEIRLTLRWEDLVTPGVVPEDPVDGAEEFTSADWVANLEQSNHHDGNTFDLLMHEKGSVRRGKARKYPGQDLHGGKIDELESPVNKEFGKAAGVQFIQVRAPGSTQNEKHTYDVESEPRQIQNQAEYFYYSGHGSHRIAALANLDGVNSSDNFTPKEATGYWNQEMQTAIFAACSVLDINDYDGKWIEHYVYDDTNPDNDEYWKTSPGELWIEKACQSKNWICQGPEIFLGYAYKSPLDVSGNDEHVTAKILQRWFANRDNMDEALAWMKAVMDTDDGYGGDHSNRGNASVIDLRDIPWKYYYFHVDDKEEKLTLMRVPCDHSNNNNRWPLPRFCLTQKALEDAIKDIFRNEGIPPEIVNDILSGIETLEDQVFIGAETFLQAIKDAHGGDIPMMYLYPVLRRAIIPPLGSEEVDQW